MLNDKPLISPRIYVNHLPRAGRSRALHSEKLPNWEALDSLCLSRFWSAEAPGHVLGMGNGGNWWKVQGEKPDFGYGKRSHSQSLAQSHLDFLPCSPLGTSTGEISSGRRETGWKASGVGHKPSSIMSSREK